MKKNILCLSFVLYANFVLAQDSVRPCKSHFNFQVGYSKYHYNFHGQYMSGGYRFLINKYILLASDIYFSSGSKTTHSIFFTPHYEYKGITLGPQFQIRFLKYHTIRAGVAVSASILNISDIGSKIYYAPYKRDVEVAYTISKYSFGYEYALTYLCRLNRRMQAGINFSQKFLESFRSSRYTTKLNLYGINLEFSL